MTQEQFSSIATYLEGFKTRFDSLNIKSIKDDTDAIWTKLEEQNEKLDKITNLLTDLINK